MKKSRRGYNKGIKKYLILFVLCLVALECLGLYFPILLQNITTKTSEVVSGGGSSAMPIVWYSLFVLGFIILIFAIQFLTEFAGAVYQGKYQANVRKSLYEKFSRLSNEQLDQIGVARILPAITNDSGWLKDFNRRVIQLCVFFPVAILGSFIMLFTLHWVYALFAFASIPFVLLFFYLNMRKMSKCIPPSIEAYDEYFLNIKEGIIGAKDIRILGKAEERSAEFKQHVDMQTNQYYSNIRAHNLSTGFNAILFTLITIAIVLYGAANNLEPFQLSGVVIINTAIQYINKIWAGSHTMFTWFSEHGPRYGFTVKRLEGFYNMPEKPIDIGLKEIPSYTKQDLNFKNISYVHANGKYELQNVNIKIPDGQSIAVAGGIGSGKSMLAEILLQYKEPSSGMLLFNEIDIKQLNSRFWRHDLMSFCSGVAQFFPGTIRDNFKLLNPHLTDEKILQTFKEIGASEFVDKFDSILDFQISEFGNINDSIKNILNIVRAVLKPAEIYVFNQCFEHVKHTYISKLIKKMKKEKKTSLFITYNGEVCKGCDKIYLLKKGRISDEGTHEQLIKSNIDYRNLYSAGVGVMVNEETINESIKEGENEDDISIKTESSDMLASNIVEVKA